MNDPAQLGRALAQDIEARAPFRHLTEDEAPDLEAAHAIQIECARALEGARGPLGGRKIAWNTPAQMEAFGLHEPGAGRVFASQIRPSGARLNAADYATFAIEPEIAAVLSAPLAPVEGGHDPASVIEAIAMFRPAFEILDQRGFAPGPNAAPSALAADIFSEGLILGGPGLTPQQLTPSALRSTVTQNGETILDKEDAAPMHPLAAVAFLANRFNRLGETLQAGEVLLLGAHLPPHRIEGAASLRFDCGALGEVAFEIA
jgi:2-keto-4-pentenoate hydratase